MADDTVKVVEVRRTVALLAAVEQWVTALDKGWDQVAVGLLETVLVEAKLLTDYRKKHDMVPYCEMEVVRIAQEAAAAEVRHLGKPGGHLRLVKDDDAAD
jgi:hypothetical protein